MLRRLPLRRAPGTARSLRIALLLSLSPLLIVAAMRAQPAATDAPTGAPRVEGRIIDRDSREPLPGATIRLLRGSDTSSALEATGVGTIADRSGAFSLSLPTTPGEYRLEISVVGYRPLLVEPTPGEALTLGLEPSPASGSVSVTAVRRSRSVEDACCRVESIREEVQQHAPFSPTADGVLSRYSSCTSGRIACAIDRASFIRLRGLEPTYMRLLLDGVPSFTGLGAVYGLGLVPSNALQTISIVEGASSGRYGNGAVSGIVDLQLRPPTEVSEIGASANLTLQEEGIHGGDVGLSWTGMLGETGLAAFGSFSTEESDISPEEPSHRLRRGVALLRSSSMLGGATELLLTTTGGVEEREGEALLTPASNGRWSEELSIDLLLGTARLLHSLDETTELTATLSGSTFGLRGSASAGPVDARQLTLYGSLFLGGELGEDHLYTVGVETFHDRMADLAEGELDYELTIPSLMVQDEWLLGSDWTLMGTLRYDHHSISGGLLSPRASLRFAPGASTSMRLMAGYGFKGEALFNEDHRTLQGGLRWRLNEELRPERSFTLNYDISHRFMLGEAVAVDANLNLYHTTIVDHAVADADSMAAGLLWLHNAAEPSRLRGIELQVRPSFGEHLSAAIGFALIDYARQIDGAYRQVPLAPRMNLDVTLQYADPASGLTIELWGSHVGSQRLVDGGSSPSYSMVNARAERWFGDLAFYLGGRNILDARQSPTTPLVTIGERGEIESGNIWGPIEGREYFVGLRYRWSGEE